MSDEKESFSGYAVLELMGHRRLVGMLSEATIAGAAFIRIDLSDADGNPTTQFYAPSAVYAITPTTEEIARRAAKTNNVAPISAWELREKPPTLPALRADEEEDDSDDDTGPDAMDRYF